VSVPVRKSAKQKTLEGNRSRKDISEEPVISFDAPPIPEDLNEPAKAYWRKIAPYLIKTRQLHIVSADTFKELCDIKSRLDDVNRMIDEGNRSLLQAVMIYDNREGREIEMFKESALSDLKRKFSRLFLEYCKQFHLTPHTMKGAYDFRDEEEHLI
jgi:hypothetical protein